MVAPQQGWREVLGRRADLHTVVRLSHRFREAVLPEAECCTRLLSPRGIAIHGYQAVLNQDIVWAIVGAQRRRSSVLLAELEQALSHDTC